MSDELEAFSELAYNKYKSLIEEDNRKIKEEIDYFLSETKKYLLSHKEEFLKNVEERNDTCLTFYLPILCANPIISFAISKYFNTNRRVVGKISISIGGTQLRDGALCRPVYLGIRD